MNLIPPNLPSPAPTPDEFQAPHHPAPQSQDVIRQEVERRLVRFSQDLYELEICAGDVVPGQEDRVPMFLQNINEHLVVLNDLSRRMTDSVPRQVVENVDQFKNPHQYTKNALSRATGENQYALGRILGLESFRRQLSDALSKDFPEIPLPPRRHTPRRPAGGEGNDLGENHHADSGNGGDVPNGLNSQGGAAENDQIKIEPDGLETVREEGEGYQQSGVEPANGHA